MENEMSEEMTLVFMVALSELQLQKSALWSEMFDMRASSSASAFNQLW